jgi:hypothetical protein
MLLRAGLSSLSLLCRERCRCVELLLHARFCFQRLLGLLSLRASAGSGRNRSLTETAPGKRQTRQEQVKHSFHLATPIRLDTSTCTIRLASGKCATLIIPWRFMRPSSRFIHTPYHYHPTNHTTQPLWEKTASKNCALDVTVRSMYNCSMDLTPHRQEIAHRLKALEAAISRLVDALSQGNFPAQLQDATTSSAARKICAAYSTIDYGMQDEVNESLVTLGIIGVNADTIKRAASVNTAKAKFKDACTPLQGIRFRIPVKGESSPTRGIPAIRVILRNIQRSDLNLLAAYRKIPILDAPPATVSYTRANTRAVYRKTVEEIAQMLANLNSPAAAADRERLLTLDPRVTHLALVKKRYANTRANILYARLDPKGRGRIQISAELPLIYATGRRTEPAEVHFPTEQGNGGNPRRIRESKLEAAPFLHALPVYRYNSTS